VMLGRVVQLRDRLSICAELVDAADGAQLWGAQYKRTPSDILELQEEIANEISKALQLKLSAEEKERLSKRYTDNLEAHHAYLKGRYFFYQRTQEGLRKGIEYFQQAIEIDPIYALAYSGMADCYAVLGLWEESPPLPRPIPPWQWSERCITSVGRLERRNSSEPLNFGPAMR